MTRRRVGVVIASYQFNESEPHPATFWNSARLLPLQSRHPLKLVYCDILIGVQWSSITNYTKKKGAYI